MTIDNLEEYQDPSRYDAEYGAFEPDGPFFLNLAKQAGGPVLDVACGTGRLTIPIAKNGLEVTGIDISEAMIEAARNKSVELDINLVKADALTNQVIILYVFARKFENKIYKKDTSIFPNLTFNQ